MESGVVCVCCGYRTLSELPGFHGICPVCGWEELAPTAPDVAVQDGMPGDEFIAAVRAVALTAPPADSENLLGMSVDFDYYLWRCPSIRKVTVSSSRDPARQLTAHCLAERAASPNRVAVEITKAWLKDLRYSYWEVHALRNTPTSVELRAATQVDDGDYFITAAIIVGWTA